MESTSFQSPILAPPRDWGNTWGARLMFSCPPARMIAASSHLIAWAAKWTALRPLPQTLLMVMAGTEWGNPATMAACRAGFCPAPAVSTCPMITSSTRSGATPVCSNKRLRTVAPNEHAGILARLPPKAPMGVRAAATITAS